MEKRWPVLPEKGWPGLSEPLQVYRATYFLQQLLLNVTDIEQSVSKMSKVLLMHVATEHLYLVAFLEFLRDAKQKFAQFSNAILFSPSAIR